MDDDFLEDDLDEEEEEEDVNEDYIITQAFDVLSDEEDDIEDLFNKNTESFRCLAQHLISRSSLLKHILYHYPALQDPGIDDAFNYVEPEPVFDDIGIEKYKNLCKDYNIIAIRRVIQSLPNKMMDLKFYGLTIMEMKTICTTLMLNTHVETLILQDNWLTPEAAFYVGEALRENNSIKVLSLKECRIGPEGARSLEEGLGLNQSLRELDLSYNNLGDDGLIHIINALQENQQVQKLNLSHNHLADGAGKALGAYLKENTSTNYLDLSWNDLRTISGLKDLCNGLIANTSVTYLNLAWNGIGTKEAVAPIVRYMKMTENLEHLDLSSNRLLTPLLQSVRSGLAKNTSLISIKLGGNLITPEDAAFLVTPLLQEGTKLTYIDLENVFVQKSFVPVWKKITNQGKSVRIEGILKNYVIHGPNKMKVIFDRCKYLAQKPMKKKQKRDFGTFICTLPNELLDKKDIHALIKKYKMNLLDEDLIGGLCDMFKIRNKVNTPLLKETFLNMYPNTIRPAPIKPKKSKKGEKKKKGEKGDEPAAEPQQQLTTAQIDEENEAKNTAVDEYEEKSATELPILGLQQSGDKIDPDFPEEITDKEKSVQSIKSSPEETKPRLSEEVPEIPNELEKQDVVNENPEIADEMGIKNFSDAEEHNEPLNETANVE